VKKVSKGKKVSEKKFEKLEKDVKVYREKKKNVSKKK
jgi:hypothetical protein